MLISEISVHRHVKNLIIFEIGQKRIDPEREIKFARFISEILKLNISQHLTTRSVFIMAAICQNEETKHLITQNDVSKKMIKKALKEVKSQMGLKLLTDALYPEEDNEE